jgi:hypothetical protein
MKNISLSADASLFTKGARTRGSPDRLRNKRGKNDDSAAGFNMLEAVREYSAGRHASKSAFN